MERAAVVMVEQSSSRPPVVGEARPALPAERDPPSVTVEKGEPPSSVAETQLGVLEDVAAAALEERLADGLRRAGRVAAQELRDEVAGTGSAEAAGRARAIERILSGTDPLGDTDLLTLCEEILQLRQHLQPAKGKRQAVVQAAGWSCLLVHAEDQIWAEQVRAEAVVRGLDARHASDTEAFLAAAREGPDALVLDPSVGRGVLDHLDGMIPAASVAVSSSDRLEDRVRLVEAGIGLVLPRDASARDVVDAATALLVSQRLEGIRVLVWADARYAHDGAAGLASRVTDGGIEVVAVTGLGDAWSRLLEQRFDLVVAVAAPAEVATLCRLVRSDATRAHLPVIGLAESSAEVVSGLYAAGVDDVLAPETGLDDVVARVRCRVRRARFQQRGSELDPLTGLPNEVGAHRSIGALASLARRQDVPLAIAAVQIDGFARLNELYGRTVGDDVLQAAAARFQRAFRDADVAARLGASEFVFALYGSGRDNAAQRIQAVADELHGIELTATNGVPVRFSMSAGVAELPADGLEPRAVRRAATEALRYARAAGGDRVVTTAATTGEEPGQDRAEVVVVEGDRELAALLVEAFRSHGWRTRQASDGQEALDLLGGPYPPVQASVLIIDAELPGPDGLTVLRRLSEAGHLKQTHPIVLTGRSTEAETLAAFEAGAADHVTKPFSLPVLMERVRAALGAAA